MDLNNDGHNDLLSGSYSRMESAMAGLFQVLWGNADGTFKQAAVLNGTDKQPLIIPIASQEQMTENICTRPTAVDWDGDGDLDLVVGNFSGTFYVFQGEKDGFAPKPEAIMSGDSPLRINGAHSDPVVIDWDADGDLDILSGSSQGGVFWSENTAGADKPAALEPFRTLIEPEGHVVLGQLLSEEDLSGPVADTRIWVDDVNADGKLDILVGDSVTLVSAAEGLSKVEFEKKFAEWQKEVTDAQAVFSQTTNITTEAEQKEYQKKVKNYSKVYAKRSEFMKEDMTGFVWLYLQK